MALTALTVLRRHESLIEGDIDLLWKYAQVRCYADGFAAGMPGEPLAEFGLWYPAAGLVISWRPDSAGA